MTNRTNRIYNYEAAKTVIVILETKDEIRVEHVKYDQTEMGSYIGKWKDHEFLSKSLLGLNAQIRRYFKIDQ